MSALKKIINNPHHHLVKLIREQPVIRYERAGTEDIGADAERYEQNDQFFRKLFDDPDMMHQVMETVGSILYERLKKKFIFDPKSGVAEEATPETYVEDTYVAKF